MTRVNQSYSKLFSKGDADLYISETLDHPTYDYESHSMSAWSCGVDKIIVPRSFPRPLHIAVYGYPRYEVRIIDNFITGLYIVSS